MTYRLEALRKEIGRVLHSDWLLVDQSMIDRFAEVTLDQQFIHVDKSVDKPALVATWLSQFFVSSSC
jgi:acyl dehydratase